MLNTIEVARSPVYNLGENLYLDVTLPRKVGQLRRAGMVSVQPPDEDGVRSILFQKTSKLWPRLATDRADQVNLADAIRRLFMWRAEVKFRVVPVDNLDCPMPMVPLEMLVGLAEDLLALNPEDPVRLYAWAKRTRALLRQMAGERV